MKKATTLIFSFVLLLACKDKPQDLPYQSDREPNGGLLRMVIEEKSMHDKFFVAQFTPRGDLFEIDNLQLFNYNIDSEKYPKLLISIDYAESDLKKWQGRSFPLNVFAFIPEKSAPPLQSRGEIHIEKIDDKSVQGTFAGVLIHSSNLQEFPLRAEFKAVLRYNQ
ncbi:hypothetical protein JW992_16615 [candidate division KSB1 bacterium]|nr:hypothetical protein [candidate division KSB1 bacterium]